jgi:hypothetical protein
MPTRRSPNGHGQQLLGADQPLQEGLVEMATIGAQSVLWLFLAVGILAAVAGVAVLAWSLRPVPVYLSERVKRGSPFDVEFWIENSSSWFGMSHLSISCVLTYPGTPDLSPTPVTDVQLPGKPSPLCWASTARRCARPSSDCASADT